MRAVKKATKPIDRIQSGTGVTVPISTIPNITSAIAQQDATKATLRHVRFCTSCSRISQAHRTRIPPIEQAKNVDVTFVKTGAVQNQSHKPSLIDGVSKNTMAITRVNRAEIRIIFSARFRQDSGKIQARFRQDSGKIQARFTTALSYSSFQITSAVTTFAA
jgi:hypothetical protein